MGIGIANIAVDHADETLVRYLAGFDFPIDKLSTLREELLGVVYQAGADNVVVRPCDYDGAVAMIGVRRAIVGMPDYASLVAAISQLQTIRTGVTSGILVKIGMAVVKHDIDSAHDAFDYLSNMSGDNRFVVEPYFGDDVTVAERRKWLGLAVSCGRVCALKLDVRSPEVATDAYKGFSTACPWYARSDGMTFSDFQRSVGIVRRVGCAGVIAGAALWRSELAPICAGKSDIAVRTISRRVERLRLAFTG